MGADPGQRGLDEFEIVFKIVNYGFTIVLNLSVGAKSYRSMLKQSLVLR